MNNDPSFRYALSLANYLGLSVFPCHTITAEGVCSCGHIADGNGGCSCGLPAHKGTCESPGKHPATSRGFKDASNVEAEIGALWQGAPRDSNIAVATGNGIFVVDCDIKPGVDGRAALAELEAKHGALPPTLTARTGSGGLHLYFRCTGAPINNSASKIGPGIDIRGDGGYVVCPPSKHKSGGLYSWIDELTPIADAPEWLTDAARRRPAPRAYEPPTDIGVARARRGDANTLDRATNYVRKMPGSISGSGGHDACFDAALALVGGFALGRNEALGVLRSEFNPRCQPPWSEAELRHKVDSAWNSERASNGSGWLLTESRIAGVGGGAAAAAAAAYADAGARVRQDEADERAAIRGEEASNVIPINVIKRQEITDAALPSDVDREDRLIATLLFRDGSLDECSAILRQEQFSRQANGIIYRSMVDLWERGETYTANDVGAYWRATNSPHQHDTGGGSPAATLARLCDDSLLIAGTAIKREAETVRDLSRQRAMVLVCKEAAQTGFVRTPNVQGYLDSVLGLVERAAEPPELAEAVTAAECAKGLLEEVYEAAERGMKPRGILTGLRQLDAATSGLVKKKQILLAGRPSMGKTALSTDISMSVADQKTLEGVRDQGVLILSLETPVDDLSKRMIFRLAAISLHEYNTGKLWTRGSKDEILAAIEAASAGFAELPILVHYKPGLTIAEFRRLIRYTKAMWKKKGITLALVVIDYIQLMKAGELAPKNATPEQIISVVSEETRKTAQVEDVPLLALAQLNRAVDKQKDKRPVLADLRGSGSLEMNADTIIFVHREEQYLREETPDEFKGLAELIIAKNKNGPTKTVYTGFIRQVMGFADTPKSDGMAYYD